MLYAILSWAIIVMLFAYYFRSIGIVLYIIFVMLITVAIVGIYTL